MIDSWWEGEHAQLFRSTTFTMNQLHFSRRDLPWLAVLPPAGYSDGSISQMSDCQSGSFSTISKGCQNCHTQHITIATYIVFSSSGSQGHHISSRTVNKQLNLNCNDTQDTSFPNVFSWARRDLKTFLQLFNRFLIDHKIGSNNKSSISLLFCNYTIGIKMNLLKGIQPIYKEKLSSDFSLASSGAHLIINQKENI